jgi:hypothetical protein
MQAVDPVWMLVGFFLTLLVFSYVFGDNPVFRAVTYTLVGVASGYLAVTVIYYALLPRLLYPLLSGSLPERAITLVPLFLSLLLLAKLFPRISTLGRIPMGYLVGIGAAVTVGGAVLGTGAGQVKAAFGMFDFLSTTNLLNDPLIQFFEGVVVLFGTIATLAYFHFGARIKPNEEPRRARWIEVLAWVGKVFIVVTLGALFAGVYISAITALIDRMGFLWQTLIHVIPGLIF